MQLTIIFTVLAIFKGAYAVPQSKGGVNGADLIGGLLKGMGGSVPNGPAPGGCSKYEIIVGMRSTQLPIYFSSLYLTASMTKPEVRASQDHLALLWVIPSSAGLRASCQAPEGTLYR
jgi:hypothetical protein